MIVKQVVAVQEVIFSHLLIHLFIYSLAGLVIGIVEWGDKTKKKIITLMQYSQIIGGKQVLKSQPIKSHMHKNNIKKESNNNMMSAKRCQ